jgi:hypothetical protein
LFARDRIDLHDTTQKVDNWHLRIEGRHRH